jgi:ABC-2 type transport system ATP-binding protein
MLKITGLTKTYPSGVQAPSGMFGLLGPNGSGKTTLMKIIATLLEPDAGTVTMNGSDLVVHKDHARRMLGYLPQEFGFYPTLTAAQNLEYFARLKGVWEAKERRELINSLLERVNLSAERNQRVGGFSGGMRQRLGIAQALIGQPELLIVDEPTAGLDPEERMRFHNLLSETIRDGTVVMLSTHIVSDVSNLCDHMAIIRKGEILAFSAPQQAVEELRETVWEGTVSREAVSGVKARCKVISSQMFGGLPRLRVLTKGERPGEEFVAVTPTLEDYYLNLVNQST